MITPSTPLTSTAAPTAARPRDRAIDIQHCLRACAHARDDGGGTLEGDGDGDGAHNAGAGAAAAARRAGLAVAFAVDADLRRPDQTCRRAAALTKT